MLHHDWCQQHDRCWLNDFFSITPPSGLPKFHIGQIVHIVWTDDNDRERMDTAEIFGIARSCEGWLLVPGWWYIVRVTHQNGERISYRPAYEEAHESELREVS